MKFFLLKSVLAVSIFNTCPLISHAQTIGASYGLQVLLDSGMVLQNKQVYTHQRGIGSTNLDIILAAPATSAHLPSNIVEPPTPIIQTDMPSDFRLAITNTDQVQNTLEITKSRNAAITLTSAPATIQLR
jgi:hypothetical protein